MRRHIGNQIARFTWAVVGVCLLAATCAFSASAPADKAQVATVASGIPKGSTLKAGEKVTFLELGSVGCVPCEAMKPVMQAVRDKYGKQVEVTFHDVRANRSIAKAWGIRLIPTQIFLDSTGKEVFRHEGFFPWEKVEGVLFQMGARSEPERK